MNRYELIVAFRYLWMARKRAHIAFLSLISMLGIAVGVATLLISLALLSGLQGKIKQRLMEDSPHLLIEPKRTSGIPQSEEVISAIAEWDESVAIRQEVRGVGWASDPEGDRGRPVRVGSYLPGAIPEAETSFGREWKIPEKTDRPILVTRQIAGELGLFLGDDVIIVAPRTRITPFGATPVWKAYTIERFLAPGEVDDVMTVVLPFDEASELFATEGRPTRIEVFARAESSEELRDVLSSRFPDLLLKTWKEINRPLFLALRLEKIVMFATISLIILVAALNLVSSLSMLIVEKRPQVGVLRTLGATRGSIVGLFVAVGSLVGGIGMAMGNIVGLGFSWAAERWHLVPLPSDLYYATHLPFSIDLTDVIVVNVIAILLSVLATWIPARAAGRLDPVRAIRDE